MLDRTKLFQAINQVSEKLFVDLSDELSLAQTLWQQIIADHYFDQKIKAAHTQLLVPSWQEELDKIYSIQSFEKPYIVASVDGSQIYPDRHQGTACFLVNIGMVELSYGVPGKGASLSTQPFVYPDEHDFDLSTDLVDCRRQELELDLGFDFSKKIIAQQPNVPFLLLFDGSLIFWHLQAKEVEVKDYFLCRYLQTLDQFYQENILIAGYISLPKSKELVNLLRLQLCNFNVSQCEDFYKLDHLVDASIARFFLKPFSRSIVFENQSPVTAYYPKHSRPHFFYADFGNEIARIEIPAWIAYDQHLVDTIAAIIANQVQKGYGYPIAIAEAHEQAVVKGPDREFFYHLMHKMSMQQNKKIAMSQKVQKKIRIGI